MAKYTIELRDLLDFDGFQLDLGSYPIFDEDYREVLNKKIIDNFYFREIGFASPERWKFEFEKDLAQIMERMNPFYLYLKEHEGELFESGVLLETFDRDLNRQFSQSGTNSGRVTSTGETYDPEQKQTTTTSDTPQGHLKPFDIEQGGYASEVSTSLMSESTRTTSAEDQSLNSSDNKGSQDELEGYTRRVVTNNGKSHLENVQGLIRRFKTLDEIVLDELDTLFIQLY